MFHAFHTTLYIVQRSPNILPPPTPSETLLIVCHLSYHTTKWVFAMLMMMMIRQHVTNIHNNTQHTQHKTRTRAHNILYRVRYMRPRARFEWGTNDLTFYYALHTKYDTLWLRLRLLYIGWVKRHPYRREKHGHSPKPREKNETKKNNHDKINNERTTTTHTLSHRMKVSSFEYRQATYSRVVRVWLEFWWKRRKWVRVRMKANKQCTNKIRCAMQRKGYYAAVVVVFVVVLGTPLWYQPSVCVILSLPRIGLNRADRFIMRPHLEQKKTHKTKTHIHKTTRHFGARNFHTVSYCMLPEWYQEAWDFYSRNHLTST